MWSSSNLRCFFWVSWIGRWAEILYFWQAPCSTVATGPWSTFGVRKLKKKTKHILDFMCIQTWWQRCITQCTEGCMVSDSPAHYKSLGIVKKELCESPYHHGAYSFILACSPDIGICKALHMILISNPNSKGLTQIYHLDSLYLKSQGDLSGVSFDLLHVSLCW